MREARTPPLQTRERNRQKVETASQASRVPVLVGFYSQLVLRASAIQKRHQGFQNTVWVPLSFQMQHLGFHLHLRIFFPVRATEHAMC